jgi:hypothetical protein
MDGFDDDDGNDDVMFGGNDDDNLDSRDGVVGNEDLNKREYRHRHLHK